MRKKNLCDSLFGKDMSAKNPSWVKVSGYLLENYNEKL